VKTTLYSYVSCFSRFHTVVRPVEFAFLCLVYFTYHNAFQLHQCYCKWQCLPWIFKAEWYLFLYTYYILFVQLCTGGHIDQFHIFAICNAVTCNRTLILTLVHFLWMCRQWPVGTDGSLGSYTFSFSSNLYGVCHNVCTNLHSRQPLFLHPLPCLTLVFLLLTIIWHGGILHCGWVCISLMLMMLVHHLFNLTICLLLIDVCAGPSFAHFVSGLFVFLLTFSAPCVFWILNTYQMYDLQCFLSSQGLSFPSVHLFPLLYLQSFIWVCLICLFFFCCLCWLSFTFLISVHETEYSSVRILKGLLTECEKKACVKKLEVCWSRMHSVTIEHFGCHNWNTVIGKQKQ
jgi:hypothetical protein